MRLSASVAIPANRLCGAIDCCDKWRGMATKRLDNAKLKELQPAHVLWKHYRPESAPFRFQAKNAAGTRRWQATTRRALDRTLGFQDTRKVGFSPRLIEEVDKGDYVRREILIRTAPDILMPFYLLTPKRGSKPWPVALAFHGHGYGVKDIVGLWENGEERNVPDGYHKDFAVALCRRGFAVAAPEISCFGERQTDFSYLNKELGQGAPTTCAHSALLAFHLGVSVIGLRMWEAKRLVDHLQTRNELDTSRLVAMGISGGGMHTFFSTALDTRIRACVVSGYYCTFRDSILAMYHCPCNFAPGLHQFGEMHDLVGLIAPRPMLVESGTYDGIFPIHAVRSSRSEEQ